MDGSSMIQTLKDFELHRLWTKGIYDALQNANVQLQDVAAAYYGLEAWVLTNAAITTPLSNRYSQLISVSTTFGNLNPSDPGVKEFYFNSGSVLRYARNLPYEHTDGSEVVNFQTLKNVVDASTGAASIISSSYIPNTGGSSTGTYNFSPDILDPTQNKFRFLNGMLVTSDAASNVIYDHASVTNINLANPKSIINLEYFAANIPVSAAMQPVFISSKFKIEDNASSAESAYPITLVTLNTQTILFCPLLKYNAVIGESRSWVQRYGLIPPSSIPGNELLTSVGALPYPVKVALYMEYEVPNSDGSPFQTRPTFRSQVPNTIQTALGFFKWSIFKDVNGDLSLIMKTDNYINLPQILAGIEYTDPNFFGLRFYVVVDNWTYYPPVDNDTLDVINDNIGVIYSTASEDMIYGCSTAALNVYRVLRYKNIPETAIWDTTNPSTLIIDFVDTTSQRVTIQLAFAGGNGPNQTIAESISASYINIDGVPTITNKSLNYTLTTDQITIGTMTPFVVEYSGSKDTVSPFVVASRPYVIPVLSKAFPDIATSKLTWAIDPDTTIGVSAFFVDPDRLTLASVTALPSPPSSDPDALTEVGTIGIKAVDSRGNAEYTGTVDGTADGLTWTLASGSVTSTYLVGSDIVIAGHAAVKVTSIVTTSPLVFTVASNPMGGAGPFTGEVFVINIVYGTATKTVKVYVRNTDYNRSFGYIHYLSGTTIYGNSFAGLTTTRTLSYENIPDIATWTSTNVAITIDSVDTINKHVVLEIVFPSSSIASQTMASTIKATYLDVDGLAASAEMDVSYILTTIQTEIEAMIDIAVDYSGSLDTASPFPVVSRPFLYPALKYAFPGTVTWTIDVGTTTGVTASFTSNGKLILTEIATLPVAPDPIHNSLTLVGTIGVKAVDSRGDAQYTGTVDGSADGLTWTLATGSVTETYIVGADIAIDSNPAVKITEIVDDAPVLIFNVASSPMGTTGPFTGKAFVMDVVYGVDLSTVDVYVRNTD